MVNQRAYMQAHVWGLHLTETRNAPILNTDAAKVIRLARAIHDTGIFDDEIIRPSHPWQTKECDKEKAAMHDGLTLTFSSSHESSLPDTSRFHPR